MGLHFVTPWPCCIGEILENDAIHSALLTGGEGRAEDPPTALAKSYLLPLFATGCPERDGIAVLEELASIHAVQ